MYDIIHAKNSNYGKTGSRLLPFVDEIVKAFDLSKILDYGCGKGALGRNLAKKNQNVQVDFYDPYVSEFKKLSRKNFDCVLCVDVLEHIPESSINDVLFDIKKRSDNVFIVVSTIFADQLLPNGDNAHCTIRTASWWENRIKLVFGYAYRIPTLRPTAVSFLTMRPTDELNTAFDKIIRQLRRKEKLKMFFDFCSGFVLQKIQLNLKKDVLLDYLKGKSVAIVGNSKSLESADCGVLIDSADVVIRINRGPIIFKKSHGSKTNIFAVSTFVSKGLFESRGASYLMWMTPKRYNVPLWVSRSKHAYFYPRAANRKLKKWLGARPSTGLMVIEAIRQSDAEKIILFGFDGFESGSFSDWRTKENVPHDFKVERDKIESLIKYDDRISLYL